MVGKIALSVYSEADKVLLCDLLFDSKSGEIHFSFADAYESVFRQPQKLAVIANHLLENLGVGFEEGSTKFDVQNLEEYSKVLGSKAEARNPRYLLEAF